MGPGLNPPLTLGLLVSKDPKQLSFSPGQGEHKREDGLVEGHAYSLIQARRVKRTDTGEVLRFLQLRNPWGTLEWKGKTNLDR
jgi:hypothetical protein